MNRNLPPRVAIATLGCKVNQSESDLFARQFVAAGYTCVPFDTEADVYVVNTCTVTHVGDKKSRQIMSQARRANPQALIVATGCYASIAGETLADSHTLLVRNRDKDRLVVLVQGRMGRVVDDLPYFADADKYLSRPGGQERVRAVVKVQDGCDSHCTYCIIPRARGRSRSVAPEFVIDRVRALVREGHAEIVITGVDLGSYRSDDGALDLGGLLRKILAETDVPRIRVSSVEPGDFDPQWLDLWADPRLCRHLHVPLQAGTGTTLERMQRSYTPAEFAAMVAACRDRIAGVTITTDVITGFPGETDAEFSEGLEFIRSMTFDGMHVFKYSKRSGTRAGRMAGQVGDATKSERGRLLREEGERGVRSLLDRNRGAISTVAWENKHEAIWQGLTDTNIRVYTSVAVQRGALSRARLGGPHANGFWAEPLYSDIPLLSVL